MYVFFFFSKSFGVDDVPHLKEEREKEREKKREKKMCVCVFRVYFLSKTLNTSQGTKKISKKFFLKKKKKKRTRERERLHVITRTWSLERSDAKKRTTTTRTPTFTALATRPSRPGSGRRISRAWRTIGTIDDADWRARSSTRCVAIIITRRRGCSTR